jgi:ribosome-associated protein
MICGAILKEDNVLTGPVQAAAIPAAPGADMMRQTQTLTSETLLEQVIDSLTDDKAEEVVQIDLRGKTEMADYMIIASGRSTRQVSAMSEKLVDRLKQVFGLICRVEGKETGDWVLIDGGDVIVHIFRPEVREFYQLEKMWLPAGQA